MTHKRLWKNRIAYLLLGLTLGVGFPAGAKVVQQDAVYQWLAVFSEVLEHIENQFVDELPQETLAQGAIAGLVHQLDPYSKYYSPTEFQALRKQTEGEYGGIGLELALINGKHVIIRVLPDSPAQDAGLTAQDNIIAINSTPVTALSSKSVRDLLRGPPKTNVVLSVMRDEFSKPWDFTLTRQWVRKPALEVQDIEPGIRYVRIKLFSRYLSRDLRAHLLGPDRPKAVILDLRNNPGGLFNEAVALADLFLTEGTIVTAQGRNNLILEKEQAQPRKTLRDAPISVLINEKSASAAEILAGALQDHHRARIFGKTSYGKGSVQNIVELSDGSGLKITVARYLTPNKTNIDGRGIQPDVVIEQSSQRDEPLEAALRWTKSQL